MKKFIIIGNMNAITCKEIFPLIKSNQLWAGCKGFSGGMNFNVDEKNYDVSKEKQKSKIVDGKIVKNIMGCIWFTNVEHKKHHTPLDLYKRYSSEYPKYDNYDAINVDRVKDIPCDYDGVMGVPISFLDKYCPAQFEIVGSTQRGCHEEVPDTKKYNEYKEIKQDGTFTGSCGNKTNENANILGKPSKGNYFVNGEGRAVYSLYSRIFIRKRTEKENNETDIK